MPITKEEISVAEIRPMDDSLIRPVLALLISAAIAARAYRRKSLNRSGAFLGFGALLLAFFFSSSRLTKVGEEKKRNIDVDFKDGGQRNCLTPFGYGVCYCCCYQPDCLVYPTEYGYAVPLLIVTLLATIMEGGNASLGWLKFVLCIIYHERRQLTLNMFAVDQGGFRNRLQVLANSGIASVLALAVGVLTGWQDKCLDSKESTLVTCLIGGIIGHYACCNGDTWSSELGVLSDSQPRLITTFKPVRTGTNGGVTLTGLLAAAAAGGLIGLTFVVFGLFTTSCNTAVALKQLWVISIAIMAGLCGSLIDSLLGATVQYSGFCTVRNKVVGKPGPTVKRISGVSILDNSGVNLVSVLLTTLLTAISCLYIF
ncbi:hypothetical protein ACLOJK_031873 [Asimina triloba]